MQTIETEFETTIERDEKDITVTVSASGEIESPDRECGIMGHGIAYTTITSVDGEDGPIKLTAYESNRIDREATEKLYDALVSQGY